ncbi:MAG: hypothetical protein GY711_34850 [bacterium]|nr:hypothetical protein [bacterium]
MQPPPPRARGRVVALVDQALVSGVNFATSVLLVRALGLQMFGTYSLVWLLVLFAVGLGQALVVQPLLTFVPKCAERERESYLAAAARLELIFLGATALGMGAAYAFVLAHWDAPELAGTLPAFLVALLGRQAQSFSRGVAFATARQDRALVCDAVGYGGQLLLLAVLSATGRLDLRTALQAVGAASAVGAVTGAVSLARARLEPGELARAAGRHWTFARWLAGMSVVQWFSSNFFLVAAAGLLGSAAVGAIKAAQAVIGVLHVLFLAMENVVPVVAARLLVERGRGAMLDYLTRVGAFGLGATVLVAALVAGGAELLLALVYGAPAGPEPVLALRGLALLYVFAYVISVLHIGYRTLERTRTVALVYVGCTLLALAFARPIVAHFGLAGAVFGMAAQQAMLAISLGFAFTRAEHSVQSAELSARRRTVA